MPDQTPTAPAVLPDTRDLAPDALPGEAARIKDNNWRLASVTCVAASDQGAELLYHFQRAMDMRHYRVMVPGKAAAPSMVPLFPCAFLAENEIQDQFGLAFDGLAPDLKGRLFLHGGPPPLRGVPDADAHGAAGNKGEDQP